MLDHRHGATTATTAAAAGPQASTPGRNPVPTAQAAAPPQSIVNDAQWEVLGDTKDLEGTKKHLAELDQRLGIELAELGPALTLQDKAKYVRQFRQRREYRDALKAVDKADHALEADLAHGDGHQLDSAADHGNKQAQAALLASFGELAVTSKDGALQTLHWVHDRLKDPHFGHKAELHHLKTQADHTHNEKLAEEIRHMIEAGNKANRHASLLAAAEQLRQEIGKVQSVMDVGNLPSLIHQFEEELHAEGGAKKARAVAEREARAEAKLVSRLRGGVPSLKKVASALFAAQSIVEATGQIGPSEIALLASIEEDSRELLEALKDTRPANDYRFKLMRFARKVRPVSRLLPLLGVGANLEVLVKDVESSIDHPSPAHIAKAVGAFLSTVGSVLEMAPPPIDLIGGALSVIGGAIQAITTFFSGPTQEQKDERELLGKIGFSHNQVSAFTGGYERRNEFTRASPRNLKAAEAAGLSPTHIQKLADQVPELFSEEWMFDHLKNLHTWLRQPMQGGLKDVQFGAFLDHLAAQPAFRNAGIKMLMTATFGSVPAMTGAHGDLLLFWWRVLHRPHFARLPSDEWRKEMGLSSGEFHQAFDHA